MDNNDIENNVIVNNEDGVENDDNWVMDNIQNFHDEIIDECENGCEDERFYLESENDENPQENDDSEQEVMMAII